MAEPQATSRQLADLEERSRPRGLFRSYALDRLGAVWRRLWLILAGALVLWILVSPGVAAMALGLALAGELLDLLALRHALRRLDQGLPLQALYILTARSGGAQAFALSVCVALAWFSAPSGMANLFCIAFLTFAAVDAGMTMQFHGRATLTRLTIYGVGIMAILLVDIFLINGFHARNVFELMAIVLMGYMVVQVLKQVNAGQRRHIAFCRDLLRRQRMIEAANNELKEKQASLRDLSLVARHAMDSVVIAGADRRIEWVNDAFTRITGYSREEAIGQTPGDLLNAPDTDMQTVSNLNSSIAAGKPVRAEILNRRRDGAHIWVDTTLAPLLGKDGKVERVVAIERDITRMKDHARELANARVAAESSERAKSEFLATMSHEIRTPMNGIIGMVDLLCDTAMDRTQRFYATTIRESAESLLTIINDILDVSRLDAGKMTIDPVNFSPGDCILGSVDLLQGQADEKRLKLDVVFDTRLPGQLHGDGGRLRQILMNLIGNAIKFTTKGGVHITARHDQRGENVVLSVSVRDTGIGIDPAQLDQVFDRFSQADAATTRRFGGTGLGLTISRSLARQMQGDITATSRPGAGSCFTLEVSLAAAMDEAATAGPKALDNADLDGLRILLAEDNKTNRILIRKYLKDAPITLDIAENGREAVSMATYVPYDLILMDMSMPELDGLDATREIRAADMDQPRIIALTANAFASDRQACFDAGMDAFLAKPIRKAQLFDALREQANADPSPANDMLSPTRRANPL